MTGMCPQQRTFGSWVYTKSEDVLAVARLRTVATSICRRGHNIAKTIDRWPDPIGGVQRDRETERQFKFPDVMAAGGGPEGRG